MTKQNLTLLMAVIILVTLNSCGTILGAISKKRPVWLMQAPRDIKVKVDGEEIEIISQRFSTNEYSNGASTDWYTRAVPLPYKKDVAVELSSASQNKTATFTLKSKGSGLLFLANCFTFPVVGHIIDAVTKNNHLLKPRYIDVQYALDGKPIKEWRGKNKLMRKEKRNIRKGK